MPIKPCLAPRCPHPAVYRGRCRRHAREWNRQTHRNRDVYKSRRWKYLRRRILFENPLCPCGELATTVDHIVPLKDGGLVLARANLQALCASCHSRKSRSEQLRRGRV